MAQRQKEMEVSDPAGTVLIGLLQIANNPEVPEWARKAISLCVGELRADLIRRQADLFQARRSAGGQQVKLSTMAETIRGLEARLEELEGEVHSCL